MRSINLTKSVFNCAIAFISLFVISGVKAAQFTKATAFQYTGSVLSNSKNQNILYLKLDAVATTTGKWGMTSIGFTLKNTTNSDVTKAKLYYNSTNSLVGAIRLDSISSPGNSVTFNFNLTNLGINSRYLFLVFDIANVSPCGTDTLDAFVTPNSLVITGLGAGSYTPINNDPAGNRTLIGTLSPNPTISISASSTSICSGTAVTFSSNISNAGTTPTCNWYVNNILQTATGATFTSSVLTQGDAVFCKLTTSLSCSSSSTVTSNSIVINVSNGVGTPSVSISSSASTICPGTAVTFSPSPVNGGISPIYKWYVNNVLKTTNSGSYSTSTLSNGSQIYCVMTSSLNCISTPNATSNNLNVSVYSGTVTPTISISASSTSICQGSSVTFTPSSSYMGNSGFYKWYVNNTLKTTNTGSYTTNTLANNDVVKCILTSSLSCASLTTVNSNTITMSVGGAVVMPTVSISASSTSFCSGAIVTFTPSATNAGNNPTFNWYVNSVLIGSNTGSFSTNTLSNNDVVYCILINSLNCVSQSSAQSNSILVTETGVLVSPTISITANSTSICQGSTVTFTPAMQNQGNAANLKWYVNNILTATNSGAFSSNSLNNGDAVSCVLTSSLACVTNTTVSSNTISISVNGLLATPSISITASSTNICQGSSITFTSAATNAGNAPVYEWYVNGILKASNSVTYTTSALNNKDLVTCKLISNQACVTISTVVSPAIEINVGPANQIATLSGQTTIMAGNMGFFSASSNNAGLSPKYQWYKNGVLTGTNSPNFLSETLATGDILYCKITSSNSCATPKIAITNSLTLNIIPLNRKREVCILDLSLQNKEYTKVNLYSLKYMLEVAGLPYVVKTNVVDAQNYKMVIGTSTVEGGVLIADERTVLKNYVMSGGILFFTRLKEPDFYTTFGISGYMNSTARHTLTWETSSNDPSLKWFNDSLEKTISLGSPELTNVIDSRSFTLNGASALATYDDGLVALTKNAYGTGFAYAFGISFKEIILRNQLNKDYEAQRDYTNAFEPSSDVLSFLIRGIYTSHITKGVWKHTSPKNSKSTLIVTHDIDAATSMALMNSFADYENNLGIHSTYFITAHYTHDLNVSNFYDPYFTEMQSLLTKGHNIGSHSVGHFNDMSDTTVVLWGAPGNTKQNYQPSNMGGSTIGATLYGELEVSKNLLQTDIGATIRTFRPGFLLIHPKQTKTLVNLGYEYSSSNTACDVLGNFPFLLHEYQDFDAPLTNILEVPLTNSDVVRDYVLDSLNYPNLVTTWKNVFDKNHANNAPTSILIHPTKNFKLLAEQSFISQLPTGVVYKTIEGYGDYWRKRAAVDFTSTLTGSNLVITIANASLPLDNDFSLIVDNGQSLSSIIVQDENANALSFVKGNWDNNRKILYLNGTSVNLKLANHEIEGDEEKVAQFRSRAVPNPFNGKSSLEFELPKTSYVTLELYNFMGQKLETLINQELNSGVHHQEINLNTSSSGIYFYRLSAGNHTEVKKLILKK